VIREKDGRVWLMRPSKGFGGYDQTFPKGGLEDGLTPQENAIKEAYEETGLKVKITGFAGDHEGDTTVSRFYFAEREGGDPAAPDGKRRA
jgi:ADP-ribose pyrophosphatase YjhB (NUDIX family)